MDPLSVSASIIAVLGLSAKVLKYINLVKDASKDRTRCAVEISNLYSLLISLRALAEEGDVSKPWYIALQDLAAKDGPLDQFKKALELLRAHMTDGGRLKKAGKALVWKFSKDDIDGIFARIEHLKSHVVNVLQIGHFKLSQAIKDDIQTLKDTINPVRTGADDAELRRLLEWISPTNYPAQQSDIILRSQEGTVQWFFEAPEVVKWLSSPKETLFCPGIPGAGKTVAAAIAIDHLLKDNSHGVAYIFCNYKAQEEEKVQNTYSMLSAILKQLVQARPSAAGQVQQLYQKHTKSGTKPSLDEIFSELKAVISQYPIVYIVIDALDECQDQENTCGQLLSKLRHLQTAGDVRLMVTSRFITEIEDAFESAMRLEIRASEQDVKLFLAGQIHRLPVCIRKDTALQEMVKDKIADAIDGMFLLARLYIDSIASKKTVASVKSALAMFSRDSAAPTDAKSSKALEYAYRDAVQRIESQQESEIELAKRVLSWITFTKRELTTAEICCALAVEPNKNELDPENMNHAEDLVSVCAGLVVVDHQSDLIRLVHYTTQKYFEQNLEIWSPGAQLYIASTCLNYLSFSTFKRGSCTSDEEFEERLESNKFLDYTAKYWGEHAKLVESEVSQLACSFLAQDDLVSCASQVLLVPDYKSKYYSQSYYMGTTWVHLIAQFGLSIILRAIIQGYTQKTAIALEAADRDSHTALYLAAEHGHHEIAELLLENGTDIDTQGGHHGTALHVASYYGHTRVVEALLERGANVNTRGGFYKSALQAASSRGNEQIVELLLDRGANVNTLGGFYKSALLAAAAKGHERIAKLLLEKGADVNVQDGPDGNALQQASNNGHERVVKLLLNSGADFNARNDYCGNALYIASYRGHEQIVKLLLEKGADVNADGGSDGTALHAGAKGGHEMVLRLLLPKVSGLQLENHRGETAMSLAAFHGHKPILRLLFALPGACSDSTDIHGRTLIWWAAANGQAATVELLIKEYNLDPRKADSYGRTPSWIAAKKGHNAVLEVLNENCGEGEQEIARQFGKKFHLSFDGKRYIVCDICTSLVYRDESHYHCGICANGDWDICTSCKASGASCAEVTHSLVRRVIKDGVWVEETS